MSEFRTFFKSDLTPRSTVKAKKDAETLATRKRVYKAVELRDRMCCRACGRKLVKSGGLRLDALQHHHIHEGRKVESTAAIVCLCRRCHDQRHVSRVLHISGNADGVLTFSRDGLTWWARSVAVGA
jgi:hypothetical protein